MAIETSLANHILIAMPSLSDPADPGFERAVVYVCEHHSHGTVGLIINKPMDFPLRVVFEQMNIEPARPEQSLLPVLFGGPIQQERGFVIHRPVGGWKSSLSLREDVTVTTSNDIIRAIAKDTGPKDALITLGYAGWSENQLEQEVMDNVWLVCPFKPEIMYDVPFLQRWQYAGSMIGVNMTHLSSGAGHA